MILIWNQLHILNGAQITDLMRLEIIYNNGGYYFDTTFEPIKPLSLLSSFSSNIEFCKISVRISIPRGKSSPKRLTVYAVISLEV